MRNIIKNASEITIQITVAFAVSVATAAGQTFWYNYLLPKLDKGTSNSHMGF